MPSATLDRLAHFVETQARPVDKFGHQPRLVELTRSIGADVSHDQEVVAAAAWLHDLGVFVGHRPENPEDLAGWDHVAYACSQAPVILSQVGFPETRIPSVLAAIRQHQPVDEPKTIEATILRDADILEQLGAIGILRIVSKVGRDTRFFRFTDAVAVLRRNLEELPGKLRLESARRLAAPRIAILRQFLQAVHNESGANLL
ncbi:MAG TPA: HD domain-containing protein [Acidobacteriaceae bacterium]|nr:HD domain-containing protein [Acidobacteriaceae bacterium]